MSICMQSIDRFEFHFFTFAVHLIDVQRYRNRNSFQFEKKNASCKFNFNKKSYRKIINSSIRNGDEKKALYSKLHAGKDESEEWRERKNRGHCLMF